MIRHEVPAGVKSEELSRYLLRAWPLLPGHVLRELMKKKDVRINGTKSTKGDLVRSGDVLEIFAPDKHFAGEVEVIFDDGQLMAAVKPQGLPSLPDRDGVGADTMQTRLQRIHPEALLCHRLDAATGGVMLASLNDEVNAQAFEAFKSHEMRKTYRAVLTNKPPKTDMTLKAWLVKDANKASVYVSDREKKGAKEIVTRLHLIGSAGENLWHAELEPVTGRTHQLRAHMAHIGCPILGDDKYGDRAANKKHGFMTRLCLWCETMEIPKDSPLKAYAGQKFHFDCPEWIKK